MRWMVVMVMFIVPGVSWAGDTINLSVELGTGKVLEMNHGSSGLSHEGAGVQQVRGLPWRAEYDQDSYALKWQDKNVNGSVDDGEIVALKADELAAKEAIDPEKQLAAEEKVNVMCVQNLSDIDASVDTAMDAAKDVEQLREASRTLLKQIARCARVK